MTNSDRCALHPGTAGRVLVPVIQFNLAFATQVRPMVRQGARLVDGQALLKLLRAIGEE